ncbi:MAG: hypothetical protein HY675_15210 [Chloroflexi bacterium]|nr:hypothetical protein [Chloroflexota bacterium]
MRTEYVAKSVARYALMITLPLTFDNPQSHAVLLAVVYQCAGENYAEKSGGTT